MSYTANPLAAVEPSTLMLYDIAAVQKLYGANMSTRAGDSVYSWTNRVATVETIWDGGGTDTIDASNQTGASSIDLREGAFSSIGLYPSDIAIAYGALIENANGGSANDTLIGNDVANALHGNSGNDVISGLGGADFLDGGPGGDLIWGGSGADVFLVGAAGTGVDAVQDFTLGEDRFALSAASFGLSTTGTLVQAGVDFVHGATAKSNAPTLFFNAGALSWDADGNGAGAPVLLDDVTVVGEAPVQANTDDLLWRRTSDGLTEARLNGNGVPAVTNTIGSMVGWDLLAIGDFNNDRTEDLLWRHHSDGYTAASLMSNGVPAASPTIGSMSGWELLGIGDLNADGIDDLIWRHTSDGYTAASLMSNGLPGASPTLGSTSDWDLLGIGDFGAGEQTVAARDWMVI
jgi:serralysin